MKIDVIIPVYKPDEKFNMLIKMLGRQDMLPSKILIANTVLGEDDSGKLERLTRKLLENEDIEIEVHPIKKKEYDHALTRQKMAVLSKADALLFMTQDAVPDDESLLSTLSKAIENGAGAAFARQIPNEKAGMVEKYTRLFNYRGTSYERTAADIKKHGIKTIYCSDTCMMYDRATFERLGGFDRKSIFAEDMTYAFKLIMSGGKLAYVSEAKVIHSHDYKLKDNFKRSFALGVNQADHPEIYKKLSSEKEGMKYVKYILKILFTHGRLDKVPYFIISCGVRYLGVLLGRNRKLLGNRRAAEISGNKQYFN